MHDVIIVGAGAAGAASAYHLAARGRRVLLLEAQSLPRRKPCGGGMAASVQRWFPFDLTPAVDQVIEQVRFTWCLDDPVTAVLPGDSPFWIVQRSRLDQFIAQQAVAAGAELVDAAAVEPEGVEIIGVQLQALARLQEGARHPAGGEAQEPAGVGERRLDAALHVGLDGFQILDGFFRHGERGEG